MPLNKLCLNKFISTLKENNYITPMEWNDWKYIDQYKYVIEYITANGYNGKKEWRPIWYWLTEEYLKKPLQEPKPKPEVPEEQIEEPPPSSLEIEVVAPKENKVQHDNISVVDKPKGLLTLPIEEKNNKNFFVRHSKEITVIANLMVIISVLKKVF